MSDRRIVFLIYLNRSGSTFLANQLSANRQICVCPEAHLAIQRLLGLTLSRRSLSDRIQCLRKDLEHDRKLASWGVERVALDKRLVDARSAVDAFMILLDTYADQVRPEAQTIMVKGYYFLDFICRGGLEALGQQRGPLAVTMVRDPRAIYNSQRTSISSTHGRPMQDSALACGLRWRIYMNRIARFERDPRFMLIKFEDWTRDNDAQQQRLMAFLGLDPEASIASEPRLNAVIPEEQRHLHSNIDRGPLVERNDAWRSCLSDDQIGLVQLAIGAALERFYDRVPAPRLPLQEAARDVRHWAAGRIALLRRDVR